MEECTLENPLIAGRYALYTRLASGGMASVYLGRLLGRVGFRRTVAVKRLHAHFALDPDFRAMFLDEARLAARIRHPNVVPTLDIVDTNDELFLVMEYIDGESLSTLLRRLSRAKSRVPLPIMSAIVCDTLAGLHAAHEAKGDNGEPLQIVHRDISPQNVLVGSDGVSRVLDFGVAKAVGNSVQTREGHVKGKLAYMAPEQMRDQPLTRLADLYSVGVILWEMTAGRRLFIAETDAGVFSKMVAGEVSTPSVATPGCSTPELDEMIMASLARDPAARFPTAREMARALERIIPPATHQSVADWFAEAAAESLASRHELLSQIEAISSRIIISSEPPTPRAPTPESQRAMPVSGPHLPVSQGGMQAYAGAPQQPYPYGPPQLHAPVPFGAPMPPSSSPGGPYSAPYSSPYLEPSGITPSSISLAELDKSANAPTIVTRRRSPLPFILAGAGAVVVMTVILGLALKVFAPAHSKAASPSKVMPPPPASASQIASSPVESDMPPAPTLTTSSSSSSSSSSTSMPAPSTTAAPPTKPAAVVKPTGSARAAGGPAPKPTASSPSLYSRD